jgi:cell filamentation protein, protein adenylyltransferase
MGSSIPNLPLGFELETRPILKKLSKAHAALAELKGVTEIIPNQGILISTLSLQEAKDSSAIENIITTHDELYQSDPQNFASQAAKEVYNYAEALKEGYDSVRKHGLLTNNYILRIQATIENNGAGFRTLPGTELKNQQTGEVVYTPPQGAEEVRGYMENLEHYINDDMATDEDPLTKMAVIHHQFESIHPFYDGNGRTGRIINVLYLVKRGLLNTPVLYMSRYINRNKGSYYRLLQAVRDDGNGWPQWIEFMLDCIVETAGQTTQLIQQIRDLMQAYKHRIREECPKVYSQELLNNLFRHPYTKVEFVATELQVHRNTATKYLNQLADKRILVKHKIGKENYYINSELFSLLQNAS